MNIFVDESGSFVAAKTQNSWNCVAAYASPEMDRRFLRDSLTFLKRASGVSAASEIKLRDLDEGDYFNFLGRLGKTNGALFIVATDAGVNGVSAVANHQRSQAAKITEHKDKLRHESARRSVEGLADRVRALSPQLYVQLFCQIYLIASVVRYGTLYFVQRFPQTLGKFRWRIDQKNTTQTEYERAFISLAPAILQTISLREPLAMLEGADYSAFQRFDFSKEDERPTYLKDTYGIDIENDGPHLNINKLMRDDLKFEDSKRNPGVQVADLLAAGVRRCLRNQFADSARAAELLGRLMVQAEKGEPPVRLIGFVDSEHKVVGEAARFVRIMERTSRAMVSNRWQATSRG